MTDLQVARFYGVDPDAVGGWYHVDFLDRLEYLLVQAEIDRMQAESAAAAAGRK